jgi:predicted nucleic acid-binding protein
MTYLLDTVILSELRKRNADANVLSWIDSVPHSELYLSVITCAEIERGIQRVADTPFADELNRWLETLLSVYRDRILPLDVPIARRWGALGERLGNRSLDLAIAATALEHRLTVVTRNASDFAPTGVAILNPYDPPRRRKR